VYGDHHPPTPLVAGDVGFYWFFPDSVFLSHFVRPLASFALFLSSLQLL